MMGRRPYERVEEKFEMLVLVEMGDMELVLLKTDGYAIWLCSGRQCVASCPSACAVDFEGKQASLWCAAHPRRGVEIIITPNYSKYHSERGSSECCLECFVSFIFFWFTSSVSRMQLYRFKTTQRPSKKQERHYLSLLLLSLLSL